MTTTELVERSLDPLASALTPEVAQKFVNCDPPAEVVERMQQLGTKSSAGTLTAQEEQEYKTLVDVGDLIALLKLKAQRFLRSNPQA